jgi:copper oxidase (laccase) domain-containing protein
MVHAGWRGLAAGILGRAVDKLSQMGVLPRSLRAAISPAIGPCCYEVGNDVVQALVRPGLATADHAREANGRTTLDLQAVAMYQLDLVGIDTDRLVVWKACTRCVVEQFHSYRRDGTRAGRQAMAVRLKG